MEDKDKPADDKSGTTTPPEPAPKPEDKPAEVDPALKAAQERAEAAEAERDRLKKEKEDRETADLSEKDKETKRANDAEALATKREETLRRVAIIQAVRDAAPGLQVDVDVEAVRDLYAAGAFNDVKLDEKTGDPIGVADKLKTLVKSKPYIVKQTATAQAPDINADKKGAEKPGEMTDERKANLKKRFRLK